LFSVKDNANGLCCQLSNPCPKELQSVPFKSLEVDRNEVKLQDKLGAGQFGEVFKGECTIYLHENFCLRVPLILPRFDQFMVSPIFIHTFRLIGAFL